MQGILATGLRRSFETQLKAAVPQFARVKGTKGPTLFSWCPAKPLTFFVVLVIDPHWDRFTIEIAWDESGKFPWGADPFLSPLEMTGEGKRFRLVRLWDETNDDFWWELSPRPTLTDIQALIRRPDPAVLLPEVPAKVTEAITRIVLYGVPYFVEVRRLLDQR